MADQARFSTAVTELTPPDSTGSALTLQTAPGFTLTGVTILLVGVLSAHDGDAWGLPLLLAAQAQRA